MNYQEIHLGKFIQSFVRTEAKFNASLIKSNKVVFRPGIDLKEMQNNLKYEVICVLFRSKFKVRSSQELRS